MESRFYYIWNDDYLFIINKKMVYSWDMKAFMKEVQYRGKTYFKYPKSDKRIAKSTLQRDFKRCNVIL